MDGCGMNINLPSAFVSRMSRQMKDEWSVMHECFVDEPLRGARLNSSRNLMPFPQPDYQKKIPWEPYGFYLDPDSAAGSSLWHEAGMFYIQEPSAMIPAQVMDARPGERILDLCAAPGGKTCQMALAMQGEGLIVSNEPVVKRARILSRNVERMGIPNCLVVSAYPQALATKWHGGFDGVMVDAPCSGEGMFRRHPETADEWSEASAAGCAERQMEILRHAARMVRPGGRLVYSTCTWNPEENEKNVERFLNEHPDFCPEPFMLSGIDGKNGMFTAYPHRIRGEGQFAARLRRSGSGESELKEDKSIPAPRGSEEKLFSSQFPWLPAPDRRIGNLFAAAGFLPDISGISAVRIGTHIGEIRAGCVIPDHAAAVSFTTRLKNTAELSAGQAIRYMRGETIEMEKPGWAVITCKGIPLGWGKGNGGIIKNHLPKALRKNRLNIEWL